MLCTSQRPPRDADENKTRLQAKNIDADENRARLHAKDTERRQRQDPKQADDRHRTTPRLTSPLSAAPEKCATWNTCQQQLYTCKKRVGAKSSLSGSTATTSTICKAYSPTTKKPSKCGTQFDKSFFEGWRRAG